MGLAKRLRQNARVWHRECRKMAYFHSDGGPNGSRWTSTGNLNLLVRF
jgi:hypothetical protein